MQFQLVLEGKTDKEIHESWVFSRFALSDVENNTSRPLNRGGTADLPLLRTLLAICQKSREPSFLEMMDSFILLVYASLVASRTLLQQLLACLNFTLESKDLSFNSTNEKSDSYELWQQSKQLKTMEMSGALPDTFYEGYIHQFQPEATHKIL